MPRINQYSTVVANNSGSSDEGETGGMGEGAESNIFAGYLDVLSKDDQRDGVFSQGVARVKEYLEWSAGGGNSLCLICLGHIKHSEAVWSCQEGCHVALHINCIQEWARNQADSAAAKAATRLSQFPAAAAEARAKAEWGCPKCRQCYPMTEIPSTYKCFCGKATDPEWDPWLAPHSCGELCGRSLSRGCDHSCLLLCHPGPCPPCPLVVDVTCYCGQVTQKRRCGHPEFSCAGTCERQLECGHLCQEECHEGACPPCQEVGVFRCACGSDSRKLLCSERRFQCLKTCGKTLSCGNHKCEQVCHNGPCSGCPFEGVRTCPCGKVTYADLACTDKASACGQTCGKLLACGSHYCQERCHQGACTKTCRGLVTKTCRCGQVEREMLCSNDFSCERRCNNMRACGRHACKRRCCGGSCPPCEETCGKKLRCGNHKCPAPCHSGLCRPCPLTAGIKCACGKVHKQIPCGTESLATPPGCYAPCPVPASCRHAATKAPHRCHYGPCPPCTAPCGTAHPSCGHTCSSKKCHDPRPPPIAPFITAKPPSALQLQQSATGPGGSSALAAYSVTAGADTKAHGRKKWANNVPDIPAAVLAAQVAEAALISSLDSTPPPCPPCSVPVLTTCLGKHMQKSVECHQVSAFSCHASCGQLLGCGNHTCSMSCHDVEATTCKPCVRKCGQPRVCSHPCGLPCHEGACPHCEISTSIPCHCGKTTVKMPCHEASDLKEGKNKGTKDPLCCQKPCHRQLPLCPHICKVPCHLGACPTSEACEEEVSVRCECKRLKAKWKCQKVQEALQAAGRSRGYDMGVSLRLIPCDEGCRQAKPTVSASAGAGAGAEAGSRGAEVASKVNKATPTPVAKAETEKELPAGPTGKQRLSKAEREALAAAESEKRRAKEARAKMVSMLIKITTWVLILIAGILLSIFAEKLLQWTS